MIRATTALLLTSPAIAQSIDFPRFWPLEPHYEWRAIDAGGPCVDPCACNQDFDFLVFPDDPIPLGLPGLRVGDRPDAAFVLSNDGATFTIHGTWDGQAMSPLSAGPVDLGSIADGLVFQFEPDIEVLVRDWGAIDPTIAASYDVPQGPSAVVVWAWYDVSPQYMNSTNPHNVALESNLPLGVAPPDGSITDIEWFAMDLGPIAAHGVDAATGAPSPPMLTRRYVAHFNCNANDAFDCVEVTSGARLDLDGNSVPDECESLGQLECTPAVPNSTGSPGGIVAIGSAIAQDNALRIGAFDLPHNSFGYFLCSMTSGLTPNAGGSQGTLCLGGSIGRYNAQIFDSGPIGVGTLALDLPNTPGPNGTRSILAGETWRFQCWHRDANPTTTSNFTDARAVSFQ